MEKRAAFCLAEARYRPPAPS